MMNPAIGEQADFWQRFHEELGRGQPIVPALTAARASVTAPALKDALDDIHARIEAGETLPAAVEHHADVFAPSVRVVVGAGAACGLLDVVSERIAAWLRDGGVVWPGDDAGDFAAQHQRFWRGLAVLLSSGVPLLHALDTLRDEAADPTLAEAVGVMRDAIRQGDMMSEALAARADLFAPRIVEAVAVGEQRGDLDRTAARIADAMRAGDLSGLPRREPRQADASDVAEDDSGLVRTVNTVVKQALDMGASDIHMEPDETGLCRVRLRVDGALRPLDLQSDVRMRGVVSRLKIMAGLDVAEQRLPQDGVIQVRVDDVTYRLRVGTLPLARGGESVAIRVLSVDAFEKSLEVIFSAASLPAARELAARPAGIVIVSGAVGSGKTTTMYAMLAAQDAERRRVVAVESAPEARFTGVSQVQLAPHLGLTAPRALRAVMHHDPDVVMIGELSDPDTVQAAAHIASTGHLVLTQMHAATPVGALMTLRELGLEPWLVNTTIAGIISQRLLRRLCPDCRRPGMPDASRVPPEALDALQAIDGAEPHVPVGCSACGGMGYRGRMAVHSVLRVSGALRLDAGADSDELHGAAKRAGMTNMFDDGLTAVAEGRTALEELCRVTWTDR